jgi:transcriptional antiterminator
MAVTVANKLDADNEKRMRDFAATLTEKDRRRFAAFEAKQQGYGGIEYIADIIGCSRRTIERGIEELDHLDQDPAAGQVRRPGAGRKKRFAQRQKSNRT